MSRSHTAQSGSGTDYEWRWKDESANRAMPESWAANGRQESTVSDEVAFYGIQVRLGVLLEYDVDSRTGKPTGLPNRERAVCRVLYVTECGSRAIVQEWDADYGADGWKPTAELASIIAKPADAGDPVAQQHRDHYRSLVAERYDPE